MPSTKLKISNQNVQFTVDTGSTINLADANTCKQLGNINLQKTHIKAYPFNSALSLSK
jgi:predicted aspartyl protease